MQQNLIERWAVAQNIIQSGECDGAIAFSLSAGTGRNPFAKTENGLLPMRLTDEGTYASAAAYCALVVAAGMAYVAGWTRRIFDDGSDMVGGSHRCLFAKRAVGPDEDNDSSRPCRNAPRHIIDLDKPETASLVVRLMEAAVNAYEQNQFVDNVEWPEVFIQVPATIVPSGGSAIRSRILSHFTYGALSNCEALACLTARCTGTITTVGDGFVKIYTSDGVERTYTAPPRGQLLPNIQPGLVVTADAQLAKLPALSVKTWREVERLFGSDAELLCMEELGAMARHNGHDLFPMRYCDAVAIEATEAAYEDITDCVDADGSPRVFVSKEAAPSGAGYDFAALPDSWDWTEPFLEALDAQRPDRTVTQRRGRSGGSRRSHHVESTAS